LDDFRVTLYALPGLDFGLEPLIIRHILEVAVSSLFRYGRFYGSFIRGLQSRIDCHLAGVGASRRPFALDKG